MTSLSDQPTPRGARDSSVATEIEQLYASYGALVRSVCRSLLRDGGEAEDAVQQTFLSAHRALLNGSSPHDGGAWLVAIARNESYARVRARMREPLTVELDEHGAAPDAHAAALHQQEARELRAALARLPGRQRDAILLREVQGFTSQEVAAALSVTTYAAESLVFRARRSLQRWLRGTLAGLSPGPLLQPLRELALRVGGGLTGPAAAKVAAVGAGTLLATGGALVGPRVLGIEHGSRPHTRPLRAAVARPARHPAAASPSVTFSSELRPHAPRRIAPVHSHRTGQVAHEESVSRETVNEPSASDSRSPAPTGDDSSAPTAHTSGDDGGASQSTSGSDDASQADTSAGTSSDSTSDDPPTDTTGSGSTTPGD